jgi:hypothetical protein
MQCQTNISGSPPTRYFPIPGVLWFAIAGILWHDAPDLGRGTGHSSRGGTSTVPLPQTTLVTWGCDTNSDTDTLRIPLAAGAFVDSPACSPPKNSLSLNLCWRAHERPPASLNLKALSTLAIWCNCGQAPIPTGRRVCSWSVRCATTAESVALCSDRTGQVHPLRGIRTPYPRSRALAERLLRPPIEPSIAPATLRTVQNVWEGDKSAARIEYYVNCWASSAPCGRHNIRHRGRGRPPPDVPVVPHRCTSLNRNVQRQSPKTAPEDARLVSILPCSPSSAQLHSFL